MTVPVAQRGSAFLISGLSALQRGRGSAAHHMHPPSLPSMQHHMDPSSNFCNYRTALQGATQRSQMANSSREKIVIPVFNLFVKDIYFLHKIHTNHLPNGHINFKVSSAPLWPRGRAGLSQHRAGQASRPPRASRTHLCRRAARPWPCAEGL